PARMIGLLEAVSAAGPEGAVEAGAKTVKIEVGGQAVDVELPRWFSSVEAQPVPLAVRDLLPKARDLLESWHLSRADAAILKTVADTLDMDLAQLIADLHSGKLNGDVALRQYVDALTRMAGEGDAAAQTMLKGIQTSQGRGLNGAALKAKADSFAKGVWALTVDQFRAQLELLLAEGIDRWAVTRFGVKPSNWVVRLTNVVKRMQGMLLLGWSPTYAINNAINNYVTLSWDGALGFHTPASNARFIEEMGFSPTRLRQGSGMADLGAVGETEIGAAIRQAQRAEDRIQMFDDLLRGTNKVQPFVALSQKIEQAASHTAMVTGMREFWNRFWKAGDGFDRLPDELAAMLEAVQPGLSQKIEQAIERGKSKAQIEKELFASLERRSLREVMTADQFALLDSLAPGLADDLDAELARARTDNEVRDAISKAQMRLVESAQERVTAAISRRIEEARQKAGTEGLQGVLDMLDQTIHERIDFWLEHFERIDQAVAAADAAGMPVDWASLNAREDILFNQYENTYGAQWLGVFEALGAGQMTDTGVRVMKLMTDMRDNWQAFYTRRRELFEDYRQKISSLPGRKERTPDQQVQAADWWEEVNRKLNNEYLQAVLEEDRLQGQFDTMFAEAFNRQFGEDPGRFSGGAERWRSAVRQVRRQQVAAMVTYRFGQLPEALRSAWGDVLTAEQLAYIQKINGGQPIYTMPWANRSKAQKEFYKKVYTTLIRRSLEASHANMPGTRVKVEAGEPAAEGLEAARSPQSPVEAETGGEGTVTTLAEPQQMPPETAQDRAAARLGELMGEGVDRANALNRVAEELGLSPEDRAALERAIIREEKDGDTGRTQTEEEIPGDRTSEGADLRPEGNGEAPTPAQLEAVAAAERRNAGGDQGDGAGTGAEGRSDRVPEPGSAARTGEVEIPPAEPRLPPVAQQFVDTGEIADPDLRRTIKSYAREIRTEAAQSRVIFIENDLGDEGVHRRREWEADYYYRTLYDRLARGDAWLERNFKRIVLRVMNKIDNDDFSLSRSPDQAAVERQIREAMLYLAAEETPGILLDVGDWDAAAEYYDTHRHRYDDNPNGPDAMWAMVWGSEERYSQLVDYWLDWLVRREEQWRQEHPEWYSAEVVEDLWADDLVAVTDDGRILTPENIEAVNATAAANEARQIASEYGIPTAAESGQQGDEPLLAILRQYGYAVDGLEGVDPGLVREVLELHKQALEAVSPEQQAEIDRRIVLERAEQLRANTERLLLESYKKQGRKA
ncbi:MAG TPA: hypothetical protein GYA06_13485, partial [Chloroflexi bacterium]|nr:hypothetical protein [Chloroflexota bacterium]